MEVSLCCFYCLMQSRHYFQHLPPPPNVRTHTHTHKHKIHQHHLLGLFCVPALDRVVGWGEGHYYTVRARWRLRLYFILGTLLGSRLHRRAHKKRTNSKCRLVKYHATPSPMNNLFLRSPVASLPSRCLPDFHFFSFFFMHSHISSLPLFSLLC